jgi:hypothetical protein
MGEVRGGRMDAVDWSGLSVLAALMVACIGYLSRQMDRRFDRVDGRFDHLEARIDKLEERYVRHLEQHAAHG